MNWLANRIASFLTSDSSISNTKSLIYRTSVSFLFKIRSFTFNLQDLTFNIFIKAELRDGFGGGRSSLNLLLICRGMNLSLAEDWTSQG